jgi:transposase-like protein
MKGHGAKFGRKKEEAVAALLSHKSVEDAARSIGLNPNTLLKWLRVPEFRTLYLQERRAAVQQSVARLQQATGAASITMLKLMTDQNVPPAVRLRAAECVFDYALKGIDLEDTDLRLSQLEAAAEETKNGKKR